VGPVTDQFPQFPLDLDAVEPVMCWGPLDAALGALRNSSSVSLPLRVVTRLTGPLAPAAPPRLTGTWCSFSHGPTEEPQYHPFSWQPIVRVRPILITASPRASPAATTALGHPVGTPHRHTVASWHRGRATTQLSHDGTMRQSHSVAVPHCGTITA
jgi:hypothetical protein